MHISITLRILGILLMLFSLTMLAPLLVALIYDEHTMTGFLTALGITAMGGFFLWLPARNSRHELRTRDGFLITTLFWTVRITFPPDT